MDDLYKEIALFLRPLTARDIFIMNAQFCVEDGFMPNQSAKNDIEPKLYSAYYYFLSKIYERSPITYELIQKLIPDVAAIICFYIASTQIFPTANKRTAAASAQLFLYINGLTLEYKKIKECGSNELADLMQAIGSKNFDKKQTIYWFHKHCKKVD